MFKTYHFKNFVAGSQGLKYGKSSCAVLATIRLLLEKPGFPVARTPRQKAWPPRLLDGFVYAPEKLDSSRYFRIDVDIFLHGSASDLLFLHRRCNFP